ncbi:unnamed protein product, partial [Porites evermanni]
GVPNCSDPCLIYSATSEINALELSTSRIVHLVSNLSRAVALDVHVKQKTIYWSDINRHVIQRMDLETGETDNIITDDLGVVDGLAVEWESNLIFWTDYSKHRVEVASLDGSRRKVLFTEEVEYPRGIALYPKKGLMFWTDWGSTPKIERATLAGTNRTLLINLTSSVQNWPNAIILDYLEDRIYWIDAWVDAIDSADLDGNNRRSISSPVHPSRDMHPFDFTVYDDVLYWSDWNTDSIERLNWTTAAYLGGFGILTSDRVFGLALLHSSRQPDSAGNLLCKVNNGGCSHLCLLTPDGYQCACPDGLPLQPDEKKCLTEFSSFLLFVEGHNIRQMQLHFNSSTTYRIPLKTPPLTPVALDYNFQDKKVYWTDVSLNTISRSFLNGSAQEIVVSSRIENPYGLAVDPFGQNIYWTDSAEVTIEAATLNGLYRRIIINKDLQSPTDIALDVTRGFMYWTDWGIDKRIEKADMDGQNRVTVIDSGLYYPNGLALDIDRNWLYWIDASYERLEVYEFPTNTRRQVISSHVYLRYPFGLALHQNHLYWTSQYYNGIYRADRQNGENVVKILSTESQPLLIHAYDKQRSFFFFSVTDECRNNNGGCSQLCLLTPFGAKCSCSDGLNLAVDGKTCEAPQQFLLFADATYGRIVKVLPHDPQQRVQLPLSASIITRPVALGYDLVQDRVYWTDVTRNTISRSFLNGSMQEVLFDQNVQTPDGLAVDIVGRNLYWTDTGTNKLEVSKLDGSYRKALITTGLDEPRDIILDISKGIMYWTDWGSNPKIEKANMAGKERSVLVDSVLHWPNGLTLDKDTNRLYWVDGSYHKLEYLDLDNNNRVTLLISSSVLPHPFGLTLLGDHVYWTDWSTNAVYRANKESIGLISAFITGIGQPMDIHGYNVSAPIVPVTEDCNNNNGGCDQLCLLTPSGRECACSGGSALNDDGETCQGR